MAKERGRSVIAQNRKARHDYFIEDVFEAGLVLTGTEVKSLRLGRASLVDGFAESPSTSSGSRACTSRSNRRAPGTTTRHAARASCCCTATSWRRSPTKTRERGRTIVPLALYFKDGRAKVEIALATGKREYDKRHALRERQDRREAERAMGHRENR